jgi:hypothetical protein
VVNVFAKNVDGALTSLVKRIDAELQNDETLRGYVVVLTEDEDATNEQLEKVWKDEKLQKLPLTTFGTKAGPKNYKINKEADVSVHLWVKRKIKSSFAFKSKDLDDDKIKEVVAAIKKLNAKEEKKKDAE